MVREEGAGVRQGAARHVGHMELRVEAAPMLDSSRQKELEIIRDAGLTFLLAHYEGTADDPRASILYMMRLRM